MASRCSERSAIANGIAAGLPEMLTTRRAHAGELRGECQHHHAAERCADDRGQFFDPSARMVS